MISIFSPYYPLRNSVFFVFEGVLILLSILLAMIIRFHGQDLHSLETMPILLKGLIVGGLFQLSLYFNDLYDFKVVRNRGECAIRLLQSLGIASIILAFLVYLFPSLLIGDWVFVVTLAVVIALLVSWRLFFDWFARKKGFSQSVLVLGAEGLGAEVLNQVRAHPTLGLKIKGFLQKKLEMAAREKPVGQILGSIEQLEEIVRREGIEKVVVALNERRGALPIRALLECKMKGIEIEEVSTFLENITGKIMLQELRPSWIIFSQGFKKGKALVASKRALELIVAFIGLVITLPLILVTAILIKIDSPGPVFISQERVGQNGKVFTLRKFRSMKIDAETETGPVWATENDHRVTRLGKFLRKVRIDEIPQMFSVLKGDMSFVGPRPERPFFVNALKEKIPYYVQRLSVKPGITGWAQIKYPYGASEEDALEKLQYDLYYIKHMSLRLDLIIIFDTLKVIFSQKGAR